MDTESQKPNIEAPPDQATSPWGILLRVRLETTPTFGVPFAP
jgi:hypothetical protein